MIRAFRTDPRPWADRIHVKVALELELRTDPAWRKAGMTAREQAASSALAER